jgi:hypothetical protein
VDESAIRNRFLELCEHLKTKTLLLGFTVEQFSSKIELMTVESGGLQETEQGWHFANLRYQGLIYIEHLPEEKLVLLALMIRAWLDEHDDTRGKYNLCEPEITTTPLEDGSLDTFIRINFLDDVYLVETLDGPIEWRESTYDVEVYTVNYAEEATLDYD